MHAVALGSMALIDWQIRYRLALHTWSMDFSNRKTTLIHANLLILTFLAGEK